MSKLNKYFFIILLLLAFFIQPSIVSATVVINELLPHPSSGNDDWIELYKNDQNEVDLSGWKLEDSTSMIKTFSDGTKIATSTSFLQVVVSNRLNNGGDTIRLKDKNDTVIDEKSYSSDPGTDVSFGRYPDGANNWGVLSSATPNGSNANFVPTLTPTSTPIPTSVPASSPTNTPVPTSTSSNTPTVTPVPNSGGLSPTKKPTIVPAVYGDDYDENAQTEVNNNVLGESVSVTTTPTITISEQNNKDSKLSFGLLFILIAGGIICIGSAIFLSVEEIRKKEKIFF